MLAVNRSASSHGESGPGSAQVYRSQQRQQHRQQQRARQGLHPIDVAERSSDCDACGSAGGIDADFYTCVGAVAESLCPLLEDIACKCKSTCTTVTVASALYISELVRPYATSLRRGGSLTSCL
jgi:hypothetical protein